ncbi:MAG TPA: DUF979 domain-containing protein [Gammaproteobacteria bacterium]|nr:DUF979 domain-containing protein [Gammaproteobacteria bacterium]
MNVLDAIYLLLGLMFSAAAWLNLRDHSNPKHLKRALFWALYAVTFLFGTWLPPFLVGCLAIGMALLAGIGGLGKGGAPEPTEQERMEGAARLRNRLFIPALLIPLVTVLGTVLLQDFQPGGHPLVELKDATLVALGASVVVALVAGLWMLRQPFRVPLTESRRLVDAVGPVLALPQLLAVLGAIFAVSGVGQVVAGLVGKFIPVESALAVVVAYCVGMALFTVVMGNAFAAFPVMTAGIGLPLIAKLHGGDVAIMGAIGMLAGYSGTLMTPLAANFNIVPAALLELPDQNGVIKVQIPTGLALLVVNTLLMYFLVFRF